MATGRWCPWCGAELAPAPAGNDLCSACGTRVAAGTALTAPPGGTLTREDPDATLPPSTPLGASPLPASAVPEMPPIALAQWAGAFLAVVALLAVLAWLFGGRTLRALPEPPPIASPVST